jgi:DNA-binding NtrC family response regulator
MLDRVRESGRAPGGIFHIGAQQSPWMLRASLMNDNAAPFYMLQLAPVEGQRELVAPQPDAMLDNGSRNGDAPSGPALPSLPALTAAGKTPLKALVKAAIAIVERHYVESTLRVTGGNRTAAAERLGLSRQSLYAKLNRYGLETIKR